MRPPRQWAVWMVVVVGATLVVQPCSALDGQRQGLVLPVESSEEQSGEPEPGPVPIWIRVHFELTRLLAGDRTVHRALLKVVLPRMMPTEVRVPDSTQLQGNHR